MTPMGFHIPAASHGTSNWMRGSMPDFKGRKVFVLQGAMYTQVVILMAEAGCVAAETPEEADIVVFIGGADINPSLYGQVPCPGIGFNQTRDEYEVDVFKRCVKNNKFMFGICRGHQFLHAMAGGTLWQDTNGHTGKPHFIIDIEEDVRVMSTSLHHQMVKNDAPDMELIAVCEDDISTLFRDEKERLSLPPGEDRPLEIEACFYPGINAFTVQGHPEIGNAQYKSWTMCKLLEKVSGWEIANIGKTKETNTVPVVVEQKKKT